MESVQRVRKTDLARNTHQVIRDVLRGQVAVVESHGQPEVAIIDIIDYHIQKALLAYYSSERKLGEADLAVYLPIATLEEQQKRYNQALAHYLEGISSLSRTAELLNLPAPDLRMRFLRLGVPLRLGVESVQALEEDVRNTQG